jgi:hypothetical protein
LILPAFLVGVPAEKAVMLSLLAFLVAKSYQKIAQTGRSITIAN